MACVLAEKEGVEVIRLGTPSGQAGKIVGGGLESQRPVKEWLGLNTTIGGSGRDSLTNLNDRGVEFKDIAAMVRAHPEWYFVNQESGSVVEGPGVG